MMMITAYPSQMQTSLELNSLMQKNSLIKIANAEDNGDSGGDDKKDDKDDDKDKDDDDDKKDDDKDAEKDENDEEKDEDSEDNNNDSNDASKNGDTSEDSTEEKTETEETDVSDTTAASDKIDETTESQETDVPKVAAVTDVEKTSESTPQEVISTDTTGTSTVASVTDGVQTQEETTGGLETTQGIAENQGVIQDPQIDETKIQQVVDKINGQIIQEGALPSKVSTDLKNVLTKELQNKPDGEISKSLEAVAGMEQSINIEYGDDFAKQIAEMIIAKYPEKSEFEISLLAGILSSVAHATWSKAVGFELTKYNEKGDKIDIGLIVKVNKSSDGKRDSNNNNDRNDDKDNHHTNKIIKYYGSKCTTQSGSIPLNGKIPPKVPILLGDFYPCKLNDGRAILNLPNTPNLQFAMLHLDEKGGNHEGIVVDLKKIQNLAKGNALFVVKFNDQIQGEDPITGKLKTIKDINAMALFNKSKQTIDFGSGNSLGISAVLKS